MQIKYDDHSLEWNECITNPERSKVALTWLDKSTFDYLRHSRPLQKIIPLLNADSSWLTIGDGRFGTDGQFLLANGAGRVHCSDMSDKLLKIAYERSLITEFSEQNAEYLTFPDNSFDYVLIKESFHHFPRPYIALSEAYRVASKAVIIIDNTDEESIYTFVISLVKSIFKYRQPLFFHQFGFEPVGNFVYKPNEKELSKFLLGLHQRHIAFHYTCDVYEEGVEFLDLSDTTLLSRLWLVKLNLKLKLKQLLCFLNIKKGDFFLSILFKSSPHAKNISSLMSSSWKFYTLPKNPYV